VLRPGREIFLRFYKAGALLLRLKSNRGFLFGSEGEVGDNTRYISLTFKGLSFVLKLQMGYMRVMSGFRRVFLCWTLF